MERINDNSLYEMNETIGRPSDLELFHNGLLMKMPVESVLDPQGITNDLTDGRPHNKTKENRPYPRSSTYASPLRVETDREITDTYRHRWFAKLKCFKAVRVSCPRKFIINNHISSSSFF